MTDRYVDLIAKLESAPEGSRELDAEIHCAVTDRVTHPKLPRGYTIVDAGSENVNRLIASAEYIHGNRGPAPRYTTSLDDKLSWEKIVMVLSIGNPPVDWTAWHQRELGEDLVSSGPAKTEAIARRLAALKARAAEDSDT